MKSLKKVFTIFILCCFCLCHISCGDIVEEAIRPAAIPMARALSEADYYYYYDGQKVPLSSIPDMVYLSTKDSSELSILVKEIANTAFVSDVVIRKGESGYWTVVKVHDTQRKSESDNIIASLRKKYGYVYVAPVFGVENKPVPTSEYFYVKVLDNPDSEMVLKEFSSKNNVEIVKPVDYMTGWYIMKAPFSSDGLSMSNLYYESGKFEYVDPAFMFDFKVETCMSEVGEAYWCIER